MSATVGRLPGWRPHESARNGGRFRRRVDRAVMATCVTDTGWESVRNATRSARATPGTRTGREWAMLHARACLGGEKRPPHGHRPHGQVPVNGRARAVARERSRATVSWGAGPASLGAAASVRAARPRVAPGTRPRTDVRGDPRRGGTARGCVPSVDDGSSRRGEHGARMLSGPARGARQLQRGAHGRVRVIVSGAVPDRERVRLRRPECGGLGLGGGIDAGRPIVPRARVVAGSGFVRSRFDRACWQRHDHRHRDGRPRLSSRAQSTRPRVRATAR